MQKYFLCKRQIEVAKKRPLYFTKCWSNTNSAHYSFIVLHSLLEKKVENRPLKKKTFSSVNVEDKVKMAAKILCKRRVVQGKGLGRKKFEIRYINVGSSGLPTWKCVCAYRIEGKKFSLLHISSRTLLLPLVNIEEKGVEPIWRILRM